MTLRRSTVLKECKRRGYPPPPDWLVPWQKQYWSGVHTVFDTPEPTCCRWRFGEDGRLMAFIVYEKTAEGFRPIPPGPTRDAIVAALHLP